jgi:phage gp36-like protein
MAYCTADDIATLYSQELLNIIGDNTGAGIATDARVQAAIKAAQGIIDAYLTTKYQLPLASTPEILRQLSIDIVVYRLALFPLSRTEEMRTRYSDAIAFLKQLANGTAALPPDTSATTGSGTTSGSGGSGSGGGGSGGNGSGATPDNGTVPIPDATSPTYQYQDPANTLAQNYHPIGLPTTFTSLPALTEAQERAKAKASQNVKTRILNLDR